MISDTQMPDNFKKAIDDQVKIYSEKRSITKYNNIPETNVIPLDKKTHWFKISDVICVYVDMVSSTKLSAELHDFSTAGVYQLFTGTAVSLFHEFDAPYIDVRGDGAFALFDSNQPYRALAAAVTFKTFVEKEFIPKVEEKTELELGAHIGIDKKTVLVRRIGLRAINRRTDRQNEVWAGKPVNMAAKLASISKPGELFVSDRFYKKITDDLVRKSCGCPSDEKADLWSEIDFESNEDYSKHKDMFDFKKAYMLRSKWCATHGKEFCENIMALDND